MPPPEHRSVAAWLRISLLALSIVSAPCGAQPGAQQTEPPQIAEPTEKPTAQPTNPPRSVPLVVPAGGNVPQLPTAANVLSVSLVVAPPDGDQPKCHIEITSSWHIDSLLAWLGGIDWTQMGTPLEQISLIAPDIELTVYERTGVHREYAFYWTGDNFIDNVSRRLIQADLSAARSIVISALIHRFAAQQLQLVGEIVPTDSRYVAALSPNGQHCAISYPRAGEGEVVLWDIAANKQVARTGKLGRVQQLVFTFLSLACIRQREPVPPATLETWEVCLAAVPSLDFLGKVGDCPSAPSALARSIDSRYLAAVAGANVYVWELSLGERRELGPWQANLVPPPGQSNGGYPRSLAFSPMGNQLAVGADDRTVTLFDVAKTVRLHTFRAKVPVAALAWSPDQRLLAAGLAPVVAGDAVIGPRHQSLKFWKLDSKEELTLPIQHEATELLPAFDNGGVRLLTAGHKTLKLWDISGWRDQDTKLLDTVSAHDGDILSLAAAQNAPIFMTCGNRTIKFWRIVDASVGNSPRRR